jgi:hypothetical protein
MQRGKVSSLKLFSNQEIGPLQVSSSVRRDGFGRVCAYSSRRKLRLVACSQPKSAPSPHAERGSRMRSDSPNAYPAGSERFFLVEQVVRAASGDAS